MASHVIATTPVPAEGLALRTRLLLETMSAGGMGGGVSSAIARALGSGRRDDASALVLHAVVIACVMGALFTVAMLAGGPALYAAMGGVGGAAAVGYYAAATIVLLVYLRSGRGLVRLSVGGARLRWRLFREILRVGVPGALNTVQTNLTVVLLTGLVGGFG